MSSGRPGRPRDPAIDATVLQTAARHLATRGYEGMSVVAIADEAGASRQAVYRRWATKADLATAAIASLSEAADRADTDDPFRDLVTELGAFHRGVTRPNGTSMVGCMLQAGTDPALVDLYRERVVAPRRRRIRHILQRAADRDLLAADADLDYATAAGTGVLYALHLAGNPIPGSWADRTARLIWRSVGGTPPPNTSATT